MGADEVAEQLNAMYGGGAYAPGAHAELHQVALADAHAMTNHTVVGATFSGVVQGYAQPVILRTRSGRMEMRGPSDGRTVRADRPTLYPVDVEIPFAVDHVDLDIIQLSRDVLSDAAQELDPQAAPLRIDRIAGIREPFADAWRHAVDQVRRVYARDELYDNDLIRQSALKHLGAVTIAAFALMEAPDDRVTRASRLVRKAERFMDANLAQPLNACEVARACGVGIRALQLAFRSERTFTPTEYLRLQRLRHVRDDLAAADPAHDTVRRVALKWGFTHAGRFAGMYLAAYGEQPHTTLAR